VTAAGPPAAAGTDPAAAYRAAREAVILADRSERGRLLIEGRDALDLLHRLSTNGIKDLRPGEGAATVFATPKGRILDLVELGRVEDRLLLITGPGRARPLLEWIERYTFREEVRVEDRSGTHGTLGIYGARAAPLVAALCGAEAAARPRHHVGRVAIDGIPAILGRTFPLGGEGFHLTAEARALAPLRERILAAGEVVPAGEACLEALRIEAGLPAAGLELTEEHNPWEAGLDEAISLTKGCYVGQEVIARLHTYHKVSKHLVRLRVEGGIPPPRGAPVEIGGRAVGALTSVAAVPGEKRVVALGYVAAEDAVAGRAATVPLPSGMAARATVMGRAR
jgi:folate-binding protein YgfZ